ncbi:MAG: helix-turn-helix domain-containing protein, partial [Myxococcales bacterium]
MAAGIAGGQAVQCLWCGAEMKNSASGEASERDADDAAFLAALGQRVRLLRARRGLTRKALAAGASVSERHLSNLETGVGNASVLILRQVAGALGSTVAEIVGDESAASAGWLRVRELLRGRDEDELGRALVALTHLFEDRRRDPGRRDRIALVGLRGAGVTAA